MTEADELLARLEVEAAECDAWDQPERADVHREAAALIRRLLGEITGRGECICAKCGIRYGGSSYPKGDF